MRQYEYVEMNGWEVLILIVILLLIMKLMLPKGHTIMIKKI